VQQTSSVNVCIAMEMTGGTWCVSKKSIRDHNSNSMSTRANLCV
jgi:hypothetical protein